MATNPGQGNTTQGNYVSFPAGGTTSNVYVYTTVADPIVGTIMFWTGDGSVTAPAGTYKITTAGNVKKKATVNGLGVITALVECGWSSTKYNNSLYTSTRNNCVSGSCSVAGSTVTLNDGNSANIYQTSGTATSNISQADADYKAQVIADAAFEAGKQNKVNELGTCTWSYTSGSAAAGAYCQTYTRNNCAGNCDPGTYQTCSSAKSGYGATSTVSCQDAINTANGYAYNAAVSEVQANGQNNANAYASCCCWNFEYYCVTSSCERRSREVNACSGATRNDSLVSSSSCNCGDSCGGTYWYYYCSGTTRMRELKYNCTGGFAGTTETYATCDATNCGANTTPEYTFQNYTTCYNCQNANVYKDTRGTCSSTNGQYYVYYNGYVYVGGQPTGGDCNTSSNCVDTGSAYCSGNNWVIDRTQGNPCSVDGCASPRVIEYNSTTHGCYTPPSCNLYELYMYGGNPEFVYVTYSVCGGGGATMSAYNDGGGGYGGQVCAVAGSAYISSGSGSLIDLGSCNV